MECAFAPHAESDYDSLLDRYIEAVNHGHDQHGKGNIAFHRSLLIERVGRDPSQRDMQGNSFSTTALAWDMDQRLPSVSYLARPISPSRSRRPHQTVQKVSGFGPPRPPRPAPAVVSAIDARVTEIDASSISFLRKIEHHGHDDPFGGGDLSCSSREAPQQSRGLPDRRIITPSLDGMECTLAPGSEGRVRLGLVESAPPVLSREGFTRAQVERRLEQCRKKQWRDGWLQTQADKTRSDPPSLSSPPPFHPLGFSTV